MSGSDQIKPSFVASDGDRTVGQRFADLVDAATSGDLDAVRRQSLAFAHAYAGPDRREVHGRVNAILRRKATSLASVPSIEKLPTDPKSRTPLLEVQPWPEIPLLLEDYQETVLSRFVLEAKGAGRLSSAGLASRLNLLLSGPPGTGKTFIASHIASRLGRQFHVVRLDSIVSSLLGDTAKNIRSVFEFAAAGPAFLFLDEFDAIAKRRDDQRELGEIKRVVNTLIQGLDSLNQETVVVAATNHSHLLDPAIFRRFPYHLDLTLPGSDLRRALWQLYLAADQQSPELDTLATISEGLSCSDVRELALASRRTAVLSNANLDYEALAWGALRSSEGKIFLPPPDALDNIAKSKLRTLLRERFGLSFDRIGQLGNVTKQAVIKSLKRKGKDAK